MTIGIYDWLTRNMDEGIKGGAGSGNWGHVGRPGLRGGSGGRGGGVGGARGGIQLLVPASEEELENYLMTSGLLDREAEELSFMLADNLMGVPLEHLEGLGGIALEPPRGYDADDEFFYNPKGNEVAGTYTLSDKVIHVHPATLEQMYGQSTLVHELGHHLTIHNKEWTSAADVLVNTMRGQLKSGELSSRLDLPDMGLRQRSVSSNYEMLADTYVVWLRGSDSQWNTLNNYVTSQMGESHNLDLLFGPKMEA